ncbi:MAG: polyhydroxyalkanoate synthesis repressor PhaR [Alphaproteobacteria bacterium]|nr:polyhydroxyalkanoate synthesis repressor PhaR [Alphaproteobacteria bacterium]
MSKTRNGKDEPTIIKKYANRRLYDTGRSSYVTLDDLCEMTKEGYNFKVIDAKSGDDITRSVLTQIIADQESKDENLLPTNFLKTLIGFYGNSVQSVMPRYLEQSLNTFVSNQEKIQEQINKSLEEIKSMSPMSQMGNMFPGASHIEELSRQNMEMFEKAMKMLPPFNINYGSDDTPPKK